MKHNLSYKENNLNYKMLSSVSCLGQRYNQTLSIQTASLFPVINLTLENICKSVLLFISKIHFYYRLKKHLP